MGEARRIVPLEGGVNFRDLGGYATRDGGTLGWGRVYRSGSLAELTTEDRAVVEGLGIRVVCDLRSNRERFSRPSRLFHSVERWCRDHDDGVGDLVRAMTRPEATVEGAEALMMGMYGELPYEHAESYRELLLRVASGSLPLLFHCSAGKDRTGVGAALLLEVAGVPRETIIEDYVLTDRSFDDIVRLVGNDAMRTAFAGMERSVGETLLRARPVYLVAMFEAVAARSGSVTGYMRDVLGLGDGELKRVRAALLA